MRSLILGLCVVSNSVFANFNAGEMMSSMMPLATTMLQNQQQAKQAEAQTDQARAQLVGQENAMVQQQAQLQQAETNNLMSQENKGYPILDPFARQSYWALRDTQFKQSMAIAAQRSQLETKASKDAIDKEFQATQQMMTAVGGLMKTAGAQVQKIGEASASKAASARTSQQASSLITEGKGSCADGKCYRFEDPNAEGKCSDGSSPVNITGGGTRCNIPVTDQNLASSMQREMQIREGQAIQTDLSTAGCTQGNDMRITCPWGGPYANAQAAHAAKDGQTQQQQQVAQQIRQLESNLRVADANVTSAQARLDRATEGTAEHAAASTHLSNMESAQSQAKAALDLARSNQTGTANIAAGI